MSILCGSVYTRQRCPGRNSSMLYRLGLGTGNIVNPVENVRGLKQLSALRRIVEFDFVMPNSDVCLSPKPKLSRSTYAAVSGGSGDVKERTNRAFSES